MGIAPMGAVLGRLQTCSRPRELWYPLNGVTPLKYTIRVRFSLKRFRLIPNLIAACPRHLRSVNIIFLAFRLRRQAKLRRLGLHKCWSSSVAWGANEKSTGVRRPLVKSKINILRIRRKILLFLSFLRKYDLIILSFWYHFCQKEPCFIPRTGPRVLQCCLFYWFSNLEQFKLPIPVCSILWYVANNQAVWLKFALHRKPNGLARDCVPH